MSREDHSDADCLVCVLLSHGDSDVIYGTNGTLQLHGLIDMFKGDRCPSLAGKPKLFFIQVTWPTTTRLDNTVMSGNSKDVTENGKCHGIVREKIVSGKIIVVILWVLFISDITDTVD